MYRYFENKADLFAQVRTDAFRRFADAQQRAASEPEPIERLDELKRAFIDYALDDPVAYRIMSELDQEPTDQYPDLEREQRRAFSHLRDAVGELIEGGQMSGDPLTVAHLFWAQVHGLVSLHLAGKLMMGRSLAELRSVVVSTPRRRR